MAKMDDCMHIYGVQLPGTFPVSDGLPSPKEAVVPACLRKTRGNGATCAARTRQRAAFACNKCKCSPNKFIDHHVIPTGFTIHKTNANNTQNTQSSNKSTGMSQ